MDMGLRTITRNDMDGGHVKTYRSSRRHYFPNAHQSGYTCCPFPALVSMYRLQILAQELLHATTATCLSPTPPSVGCDA